jgi:hypothetical protein
MAVRQKRVYVINRWSIVIIIALCCLLFTIPVSAAVYHNLISTKSVGVSSIVSTVGVNGSGTRIVGFLGAASPVETAANISVNVFPVLMFFVGILLIFRLVVNKNEGNATLVYVFLGIMLLISFLVILQNIVNAL